jgi:hypothetical protein
VLEPQLWSRGEDGLPREDIRFRRTARYLAMTMSFGVL